MPHTKKKRPQREKRIAEGNAAIRERERLASRKGISSKAAARELSVKHEKEDPKKIAEKRAQTNLETKKIEREIKSEEIRKIKKRKELEETQKLVKKVEDPTDATITTEKLKGRTIEKFDGITAGQAIPITPDDLITLGSIVTGAGIIAGAGKKILSTLAIKKGTAAIIKTGSIMTVTSTTARAGYIKLLKDAGLKIALNKGQSFTIKRGIIGRGGKTVVDKLFKKLGNRAGTAERFATNPKTIAGTTSLLAKLGLAVGALGIVGTVVGSYPFAEFELAEATDKIGIAMFVASKEGDFETVVELQEYLEEMLNEDVWEQIISMIPYANVQQNVKKNIAAARKSAETLRKLAEGGSAEGRLAEGG